MSLKLKQLLALPLLVLILACTACSTTDKHEQDQVAGTPVDKDGLPILTDEQKDAGIICKREPVTGTRISKKTCSTPEQRARAQQAGQDSLIDSQRRSTSPTISE